jgi:tetratricopeptide (TPR) repeat protein
MEMVLRLMGFAFILNNDYAHMLNYTKRIFECYPLLVYQKTDPLRLSLLCWQAYAHMGLGNYAAASRISKHAELLIRKYSFDFLNGRHIEVLQKLIQAHLYFHEKELNKAIRTAEAAIDISQKMDFKLFILMGYQLLNKIYPQLRMEKPQNQSQQQITLINKSTSFRQINKLWA